MSEAAKENSYTHIKEEIEGVNRTYTLDLEIERDMRGDVVTRLTIPTRDQRAMTNWAWANGY